MKSNKNIWTISTTIFIHMDKEVQKVGGGSGYMKQTKLNYRFHNPNEVFETAEYIAKVLVEANKAKLEQVIQEMASQSKEQILQRRSHSM